MIKRVYCDNNQLSSLIIVIFLIFSSFIAIYYLNYTLNSSAEITGEISDIPHDTNSNDLIDYLDINVNVNIDKQGEYMLSATLFDNNNTYIDYAINKSFLGIGIHNLTLRFMGSLLFSNRNNGYFKLMNLSLFNNSGLRVDYIEDAYATQIYSYIDFERPGAYFTLNYTESRLDINSDEQYDILRIEIDVNITIANEYVISGSLIDKNNKLLEDMYISKYYYVGEQIIGLNFSGSKIYSNRLNTTFRLVNLKLRTYELYDLILVDRFVGSITSDNYSYLDFQRPTIYFEVISSDYGFDLNNNNLFDFLSINLTINSISENEYIIYGELWTSSNVLIEENSNTYSFPMDLMEYSFNFSGHLISNAYYSGLFYLKDLSIFSTEYELIDQIRYLWFTSDYSYTQFEIPPTTFISYIDYGKDLDNNSKFENLSIEIITNFNEAGNYNIVGYLRSPNNNLLDSKNIEDYFNSRIQTVVFDFSGYMLYQTFQNNIAFVLDIKLLDSDSDPIIDQEYAYTTRMYNYTEFEVPPVLIQNITGDTGIDINQNGYYNYLRFFIEMNNNDVGNYQVISYLYDESYNLIDTINVEINFKSGVQIYYLDFDGNTIWNQRINGKYILSTVMISDLDSNLISVRYIGYISSNYSYAQFQPPSAYFTGQFDDFGEDLDKDGLFGGIQLNASVNVTEPGEYTIEASLFSQDNIYLDKVSTTMNLEKGTHIIPILFSGQKLRIKEKDGPYIISYVKITNSTGTVIDYLSEPHKTAGYNSTQFEDAEVMPKSSEEESSATWIIILAVVIIALVAVALIMVLRKRAQGT